MSSGPSENSSHDSAPSIPPQDDTSSRHRGPGTTEAPPPRRSSKPGPGRVALIVVAAAMSVLMGAGLCVGALVLPLRNAWKLGWTGFDSPTSSRCDRTIAVATPMIGAAQRSGEPYYHGVKLAVNEYNADHGDCQVRLATIHTEPDDGNVDYYARPIVDNDAVIGVVGPISVKISAVTTTLANAGLPSITPSITAPDFTDGSLRFRALGNDDADAEGLVRYLRDVVRAQKIYVLVEADPEPPGPDRLLEIVRKGLPDKIVGTRPFRYSRGALAEVVSAIKANGVDVVVVLGPFPDFDIFVQELRNSGVTTPVVGTHHMLRDHDLSPLPPKAEGVTITCTCIPPERVENSFGEKYEREFGRRPRYYAAEAYDAAKIFLAGIAAGVTTRDDMRKFVARYDGAGVTKHFRFTDDGELDPEVVPVWTLRVRAGRFVPDAKVPR